MPGSEDHFWVGVLCGAIVSPFAIACLIWLASLVGRKFKQMSFCSHQKAHFENWPDGGNIEVCDSCKMSRYHWEQGQSGWIMIENIEEARKEVQEALEALGGSKSKTILC